MSGKETLSQFTMNLRWILRQRNLASDKWAETLVGMTRRFVTEARATGLLLGAEPKEGERLAIAEMSGHEVEELVSVPLYGHGDTIRRENLRYLLEALPKGEAKEAAKQIGITASQLSRWRGGNVDKPHPTNVRKLLKFHGIDPDIALDTEPLFLSMEPISGYGKKQWLVKRVMEMPADEIAKIYPALKRMLRHDETD
ncbi:MAG: hypothetical protein JWL59_4811 [Chthoniobacteraceae bacterium]|nr:hypothetical protein [Chthoniobacteraceae bacterium]